MIEDNPRGIGPSRTFVGWSFKSERVHWFFRRSNAPGARSARKRAMWYRGDDFSYPIQTHSLAARNNASFIAVRLSGFIGPEPNPEPASHRH